MRRRLIGGLNMELKFLGEVSLEEENRYIELENLKCTRVMIHLERPTALTATTNYGYFGLCVNDKAIGSNVAMYEADPNVNLWAEIEKMEGAIYSGRASMRGTTGAPTWSFKIDSVEIEKINKVAVSHAGGGLLPKGTTMKVWGC